jgi:hypothetical protein
MVNKKVAPVMSVDPEIYLYRQLGSLPLLVMLLIGAVCTAMYARRRPRECVLTAIALSLVFGVQMAGPLITIYVFQDVSRMTEIRLRVLLDAFLHAVPQAIAWGLLLWVVFRLPGVPSPNDRREGSRH